MTEIDGYISSILNDYECHKSKVLPDPADHLSQVKKQEYCQTDKWTYLTDDNAVIASISAYLQSEKNNPLIVGYWVLDDQASWDTPGYAINILNKTGVQQGVKACRDYWNTH